MDKSQMPVSRKGRQPAGAMIEGGLRMVEVERWLADSKHGLLWGNLFDCHTGLLNANLFCDRLMQACLSMNRGGPAMAVLMMQLDQTEAVVKTYGNEVAERMLIEVVQRIHPLFRETDSLARLGHNELAAMLLGAKSGRDAAIVAERICKVLRMPVQIDGLVLPVTLSIGIAANPNHGVDDASLLDSATQAMQQARRSQRQYEVHGALPVSPSLAAYSG